MIPKILHFIWLGKGPLPEVMHDWVVKWRDLNSHAGWQVLLWTDDSGLEILSPWIVMSRHSMCCGPVLRSCHPSLLAQACHLAQRANIWRYEIVAEFGGVYLDTDVEPKRPVGNVLAGLDAFVVPHADDGTYLANSVFGAVPHHPLTCDLVRNLAEKDPTRSLSMGSRYFTDVAARHPAVRRLDPKIFYHDMNPWTVQSGLKASFVRAYPPETVGVHHFAAYWHGEGFKPLGEKTS